MPRPFPIVFAALALLGAGHPALAEEGLAKRGTTYTTDGDVSQYRQQPNRSRSQIFILRGSEAKASQKDPGVLVRLALWEAGAEDTAPAERALAQAMVARRAQGAGRIDPESAATIKLLCAGALRGRPACDTVLAIEAPASGR